MTPEEYAAIEGMNFSTLKHIDVSPLKYKLRLTQPEESKPAYVIGSAAHCAILEPELFEQRYAVYEPRRAGKAWEAWQAEHPTVETMKQHEMDDVLAMARAVQRHPVARELLRGGCREEAITWTDPATGVACKGRLDYLRPDLLIDLKGTRVEKPEHFERDAYKYLYPAQVAWYHDGATEARRIDGKTRPYIIAIPSSDPYDPLVFQLKQETLDWGRARYRQMLQRVLNCQAADYWPGVAPQLLQLGLPPWADQDIAPMEDF